MQFMDLDACRIVPGVGMVGLAGGSRAGGKKGSELEAGSTIVRHGNNAQGGVLLITADAWADRDNGAGRRATDRTRCCQVSMSLSHPANGDVTANNVRKSSSCQILCSLISHKPCVDSPEFRALIHWA